MPPRERSIVDVWIDRCSKIGYGLAFTAIILMWARPHLDNLFNDHREFLKSAGQTLGQQAETQKQQAEILAGQGTSLSRIEEKTDRTAEMIRDIHGRLVQKPFAAISPQKPAGEEIKN